LRWLEKFSTLDARERVGVRERFGDDLPVELMRRTDLRRGRVARAATER
jgi:hypothetical protein